MAGTQFDHQLVASSREEFIKAFYEVSGRTDIEFGKLIWISNYVPNVRMTNSFGKGKVFLAGGKSFRYFSFLVAEHRKMRAIPIRRMQVSRLELSLFRLSVLIWWTGQGLNTSVNDSHNLGAVIPRRIYSEVLMHI